MAYFGQDGTPRHAQAGGHDRHPFAAAPQGTALESDPNVELRNQVVDRLRQMNVKHGLNAYELRNNPRSAIGPYGLVFFYRDRAERRFPGDSGQRIAAAYRIYLDGEESRYLFELLGGQLTVARDHAARGRLDPRRLLCTNADEMSDRAEYVGIGLSSLDSDTETWAEIARRSTSPLEIGGIGYALLNDGTRLVIVRQGAASATHIYSTATLGDWLKTARAWNWLNEPDASPSLRSLWQGLGALNEVIVSSNR